MTLSLWHVFCGSTRIELAHIGQVTCLNTCIINKIGMEDHRE